MAEPARNRDSGIEPDIAPNLEVVQGGGESTSDRGNLRAVSDLESNPEPSRANDSIDDQEKTPSNVIRGPWESKDSQEPGIINKFTGANNKSKVKVNIFKRKGPLAAIVSGLVLGAFGITSIFTPATLLINLKENFVNKYDTQNTTMTVRMNKVIASKIVGESTSGSCQYVKIACKFSRPSNNFLSKLSDNGIKALKADGSVIEKTKLGWPNDRPTTYEFTDKTGKKIPVTAKELSSKLTQNPEFGAAFHRAFNPHWMGYADSVASNVLKRFNASKSNKLAPDTDSKKANDTLNKESAGKPNAASKGAASGIDSPAAKNGANTLLTEAVEEEAKVAAKKIGKSGGDPIIAVGAVTCLGLNAPGFVAKVARAYQMVQLVKYGLVFLTVADAIKAGEATPAQVASIGTILTDVYKNKDGTISNGSAMDSFGIKNVLFGDTNTKDGFKKDYKTKVPGGQVSSIPGFAPIMSFSSNSAVQDTCNLINSPQVQVGVAAAEAAISVASAGIGAVAIVTAKIVGKAVVSMGIIDGTVDVATKFGIIKGIVSLVPTKEIIGFFLGDFTKNLEGEDAGNGLTSAISNYMSIQANASANAPLTKPQALAYSHLSDSVKLAYAKEDQATLSPFDGSNPNTLVGSIVTQMLPYYSELSSVSGTMSFFGNILGRSMGYIAGKTSAASDANLAASYNMCPDAGISATNIAAGPFCNIIYGIPTEYISEPTNEVLTSLSSQINDESGEPNEGSDLANWLEECTTGDTRSLTGCAINDKKTAEYALYFNDHRIQKILDAEDETAAPTASNLISPVSTGSAIDGDDYKQNCTTYAYCTKQCVDFVLYRLVKHGVVSGIMPLGNGKNVVATLGGLGFKVDQTPAVHAVMSTPVTSTPQYGHTAIVSEVRPDGSFVVEEYNFTRTLQYDTRVISKADIANKQMTFAHTETKYQ